MIKYHDAEWGVPLYNDKKLFEFIILDAFQAGLSWRTVLHKRKNFERAFANFNVLKISKFSKKDVARLMQDAGIIRNRMKIEATIINAKKFLEIKKEFKFFSEYIWQFTNHKTVNHKLKSHKNIPAKTHESDAMSEDLKKRGFKFVGSTICYAFMQAAGMVNDHTTTCFRHKEVSKK